MMKLVYFLFVVILLVNFSACTIEEAKPSKFQELIIASDCLEPKDTILFQRFSKSREIRLKIWHMSADSIHKHLDKEGLNTRIDAVILFSSYNMYQLDKKNHLQKISDVNIAANLLEKFRAPSGKWVGLGIDPIIFVTLNDTSGKLRTYSDLLKNEKWCSDLNGKSEWYPFYAPIVQKMDPQKDYNALDWIKSFTGNKSKSVSYPDSLTNCNNLLTRYSMFHKNQSLKKSHFKKGKLIYPNQRTGGSFYNMICFGIIKQAKNYTNALTFFEYLMDEKVNKRLNNYWRTFPVITSEESSFSYQNVRFKKYRTPPMQLTPYYQRVENILNRIE